MKREEKIMFFHFYSLETGILVEKLVSALEKKEKIIEEANRIYQRLSKEEDYDPEEIVAIAIALIREACKPYAEDPENLVKIRQILKETADSLK